ncbi:MAG: site-2 protease family protein, partial [Ilumatobacteraceae bacterium]
MTLECGRIAGVPVRLHWSALIVAAYLAYSLGTTTSIVAALVGVIGFGLSILGHEVGHALIARRFGVATTSIDLWALGGVARLASEAPSPRSEGFIAVAGPGASALISLSSWVGWLTLPVNGIAGEIGRVLLWLAILNAALCVFNMLPGSPLDGGRVLRAVRWARHGDRPRAVRESARSGMFIGVALVIASIALTVSGRTSVMLVFVGLFIAANARAELTMGQLHDSVSDVTIGSVAWLGLAHADEITTVAEIIDQQQRLGEAEAVLVVAQRDVVGIALV